MSLNNNRNVIVGTAIKHDNHIKIVGQDADVSHLRSLTILDKALKYTIAQYDVSRDDKYYCAMEHINKLILQLRHQCPKVCDYKNQLAFP